MGDPYRTVQKPPWPPTIDKRRDASLEDCPASREEREGWDRVYIASLGIWSGDGEKAMKAADLWFLRRRERFGSGV